MVIVVMTEDGKSVRWGDGRRADSDFAREQILDAALRCYQKNTLEKTRMEHIAREAKVSRTTIYRHFRNRDDIVLGVVFRELNDLIGVMREQTARGTCFAEFIVETLALADEQIRSSPVLELLVRETAAFMSRMQEYSSEVVAFASMYLRARFDAAKEAGEVREGIEFEEFTDWISHVGASFLMMSSAQRDANAFRRKLWRYLIPSIVCEHAIPINRRA